MALIVAGLWNGRPPLQAFLILPLALLAGQLFTLGHDAGHGSYSSSPILNALVGRLALLPSLHVFGLWRLHHDIHHRFTNLRSHDFVWTPKSVAEYRQLGGWGRTRHRMYRHRSGLGLGAYYTFEIWASRMIWPLRGHRVLARGQVMADCATLYLGLAALAVSAWAFVRLVDPARAGDYQVWLVALMFLLVLPLLGAHWLIGFVIYLNHTHPDIEWFDDLHEWSGQRVQIEGSVAHHYRRFRYLPLPHRILNHTAHHVDPRVPLGKLAAAQGHLAAELGSEVIAVEWTPQSFSELLSCCKLYDYESKRWLTYEAAEQGP